MSLNGALSYPSDPADLMSERMALKVGETFAFDIKSNAKIGEDKIEYFWSSDKNNGYASNYYSGHLTLSDMTTGISDIVKMEKPAVYIFNDVLYLRNAAPANIEVYNILGVKVKSADNVSKLSIQEFNPGIYLVKVDDGRQLVKVIKQ